MMRRMVRLVSSPVNLLREGKAFVIRDNAAGYSRKLTDLEWARLGKQWIELEYDRLLCEGKIPPRKGAD
jgi:hypothetical protein